MRHDWTTPEYESHAAAYQAGECLEAGALRYSLLDLEYGRQYAADYLAEGEILEPLLHWDLAEFAAWCDRRLMGIDAAELET